jgi:hypothetical protein
MRVSREMRARLSTNRHGKLTTDQWKDLVMEPLSVLLLLLAPVILILGPRLVVLFTRGFIIMALLMVVVVVLPLLFRAWRYARAPVHFGTLYAGAAPRPRFLFWQAVVLHTTDGHPLRFKKRLTAVPRLSPNHAYLAYYLEDAGQYVLLSLAPANHPDAEQWQPSAAFHNRFDRRSGR